MQAGSIVEFTGLYFSHETTKYGRILSFDEYQCANVEVVAGGNPWTSDIGKKEGWAIEFCKVVSGIPDEKTLSERRNSVIAEESWRSYYARNPDRAGEKEMLTQMARSVEFEPIIEACRKAQEER